MNNRHEIRHPTEKKSLAYGNDHAVGWFVQVWDTTNYPEPDCDNIIIDKDEMFNHIGMATYTTLPASTGLTPRRSYETPAPVHYPPREWLGRNPWS